MNPPICKLCETRHWLDEEHKPGAALDKVREVGAEVLGYEKRVTVFPDPNPPESVTTVADEMMYVPTSVPTPPIVPTEMMTSPSEAGFCDECGVKPVEGRYKKCSACRKRAYRERSK